MKELVNGANGLKEAFEEQGRKEQDMPVDHGL
jgi:hypothetical protein